MNHSILTEPWLPHRVPRARAHLRLFRFPYALHGFPGGHFFIRQAQHAVLATLGEILRFGAQQRAVSGPRREPEI